MSNLYEAVMKAAQAARDAAQAKGQWWEQWREDRTQALRRDLGTVAVQMSMGNGRKQAGGLA